MLHGNISDATPTCRRASSRSYSLGFSLPLGSSASFLVLDISSCGLNGFVGDARMYQMLPLPAAFSLADQEPETAQPTIRRPEEELLDLVRVRPSTCSPA